MTIATWVSRISTADADGSAGRRVHRRVAEQRGERLLQPLPVGERVTLFRIERQSPGRAQLPRVGVNIRHRGPYNRGHMDRRRVHRQRAELDPPEIHRVIQPARRLPYVSQDGIDGPSAHRVVRRFLTGDFGPAGNGVERRADVVRHAAPDFVAERPAMAGWRLLRRYVFS